MISIGQEYKERYEDAERKLAALREELSGYRAANMVLRDELKTERYRADAAVGDANEAEQRLADAERRNAAMEGALERVTFRLKSFIDAGRDMPLESATVTCDIALRALNPNPEAASQ